MEQRIVSQYIKYHDKDFAEITTIYNDGRRNVWFGHPKRCPDPVLGTNKNGSKNNQVKKNNCSQPKNKPSARNMARPQNQRINVHSKKHRKNHKAQNQDFLDCFGDWIKRIFD